MSNAAWSQVGSRLNLRAVPVDSVAAPQVVVVDTQVAGAYKSPA